MKRRTAHRLAAILAWVSGFILTGWVFLWHVSDLPTSVFLRWAVPAAAVIALGITVMVATSEPPKNVPGQETAPSSRRRRPLSRLSGGQQDAATHATIPGGPGALAGHLHRTLPASLAAVLAVRGHLAGLRLSRRPQRAPGRHKATNSTEGNERLADTGERDAVRFTATPAPALDVAHEGAPEAPGEMPEADDDPGPLWDDDNTTWRLAVAEMGAAR